MFGWIVELTLIFIDFGGRNGDEKATKEVSAIFSD